MMFLEELEKINREKLLRKIPSPFEREKKLIDFCSNDYLGFSKREEIIKAGFEEALKFGAGACASRLLSGTLHSHIALEDAISFFKGYEKSILFSSGFLANIGIFEALLNKNDFIFLDRYCHASIIDGAMKSRAKIIRYKHNDLDHLRDLIKKKRKLYSKSKIIICTESVFSMDGDVSDLKEITKIGEEYDAIIYVDEAHGTGVFGDHGEGLIKELGLEDKIHISMGTLSKALGSQGGFICAKREIIDLIINKSRSFIYTTGLSPFCCGAAIKALDILKNEKGLGKKLLRKAEKFRNMLKQEGISTMGSCSQIVPAFIGDEEMTIKLCEKLKRRGLWVLPIRPPTVPKGTSRIRFSINLTQSDSLLEWAASIVIRTFKEEGMTN